MAITYDTQTVNTNSDVDTSTSFSHTIGTGTNVYVGVCVAVRGGGNVTALTIDGSAGTFRARGDTTGVGDSTKIEYWDRVLGSTNGAVTIVVTVTSADGFRTTAFSLFGVDQTTPVGTVPTPVTGTSNTLSIAVTSAAGELVMASLVVATSGVSGITPGAGETQRWLNTVDFNNTYELGVSEPGAGTVNIVPTWTGGNYSALVAVPVKPAADVQPIMLRFGAVPGMNTIAIGGPLP